MNSAGGEERFVRATLLSHLLPVMSSVLLVQLCSIGNNLIVSNLIGHEGLALMSALNPVGFTFSTLGSLICVGGALLAGVFTGKNDAKSVDSAFTLSFWGVLVFGVLAFALGQGLTGPLLRALSVPEELFAAARSYLRLFLFAAVPAMGIYIPFNYLRLVGGQRKSVAVFGLMAALNIGLDLLFVLVLDMGMRGVALATAIANWLAFLPGLWLLLGKRGGFHVLKLRREMFSLLPRLLRLGSPSAVNNFCNVLRVASLNAVILGALGSAGLTAFGLIGTVNSFSVAINSGVSQTMSTFAGVFCSEKDNISVRQLMKYSSYYGLAMTAALSLLVSVLSSPVCSLFNIRGASLVSVCVPALCLFSVSLIPACENLLLTGLNQANRRAWLANGMTVCRGFVMPVALCRLCLGVFGPNLLWLGLPLAELVTLGLYFLAARLFSHGKKDVSPVLLLDTRAETEGRYIAFAVPRSDLAAAESSERISEFCRENDLNELTATTIALAIEEIIISFNSHSLAELPNGSCNVRILLMPGLVVLRFRCAGRSFDPIAYAEANQGEMDSIGISMIIGLANVVDYKHTFGVNNLTIII